MGVKFHALMISSGVEGDNFLRDRRGDSGKGGFGRDRFTGGKIDGCSRGRNSMVSGLNLSGCNRSE